MQNKPATHNLLNLSLTPKNNKDLPIILSLIGYDCGGWVGI